MIQGEEESSGWGERMQMVAARIEGVVHRISCELLASTGTILLSNQKSKLSDVFLCTFEEALGSSSEQRFALIRHTVLTVLDR